MKRSKGKLVKTLVKHAMVKCACAISSSQKKQPRFCITMLWYTTRQDIVAFKDRETPEIAENHSLNFTWDINVSHNERRMHNYI